MPLKVEHGFGWVAEMEHALDSRKNVARMTAERGLTEHALALHNSIA